MDFLWKLHSLFWNVFILFFYIFGTVHKEAKQNSTSGGFEGWNCCAAKECIRILFDYMSFLSQSPQFWEGHSPNIFESFYHLCCFIVFNCRLKSVLCDAIKIEKIQIV